MTHLVRTVCLLRMLALAAAPVHAQSATHPELRPSYSPLFAAPHTARDSVARPTHWKTGALVGGVTVGGLGLVSAWALTGDTDSYRGDDRHAHRRAVPEAVTRGAVCGASPLVAMRAAVASYSDPNVRGFHP